MSSTQPTRFASDHIWGYCRRFIITDTVPRCREALEVEAREARHIDRMNRAILETSRGYEAQYRDPDFTMKWQLMDDPDIHPSDELGRFRDLDRQHRLPHPDNGWFIQARQPHLDGVTKCVNDLVKLQHRERHEPIPDNGILDFGIVDATTRRVPTADDKQRRRKKKKNRDTS